MSIRKHQRPNERAALKAEFMRHASVILLAPRRVGKSWLMKRLGEDMAAEGWLCISVDLEGKAREEDFLRELCSKLEETRGLRDRALAHMTGRFRRILSGATDGNLADAIGKVDHREFLDALVKLLDAEERPTLILIDELALFVQALLRDNPEQAHSLLYHLRKLRQEYRNVRWFLTGSIGLDSVSRRHGLEGALLGLETWALEPFTPDEARSFIDEVFERVPALTRFQFNEGAFEHLVDEVGWLSPYHIEQVLQLVRPEGEPPSADVVRIEAALDSLLKPHRRLHFSTWEDHVRKNFESKQSQLMWHILDILCENSSGEGEMAILTRLNGGDVQSATRRAIKDALIALEVDAYLVRVSDRWMFRSGLLRRYWMEYCQK